MIYNNLLNNALHGDDKSLARCISIIENEVEGYEQILLQLPNTNVPIIGITGPPGAGKSTLTDQLIQCLINDSKKVAVLCIDPSSAFNHGAILGDRIRMSRWYNTPQVYIRSLASKATLGGLCPKVIEITDLLKAAQFDYIIVETIGVGQNEIEIAALADITVVVLVPEGGDEIQTMKAGLMEVADIFVVNKGDRVGADTFLKNLRGMLAPAFSAKKEEVFVLKTTATKNEGVNDLYDILKKITISNYYTIKKMKLYAQKAYLLITKNKMKGIDVNNLQAEITMLANNNQFNLYKYLQKYNAN